MPYKDYRTLLARTRDRVKRLKSTPEGATMLQEKRAAWYAKNRSKCLAYQKEYQKVWRAKKKAGLSTARQPKDDPHCRMMVERLAKAETERNRRVREECFAAYGGKCMCCGETEKGFLTIDHINRNWRETGRGAQAYARLRSMGWPKDEYRLLCMNCNWAQRQGARCPHETQAVAYGFCV